MEECPICFGTYWVVRTPCKHLLCLTCLIKLRKDECPTCRKKLYHLLPIEIQRIITMSNLNEKTGELNINNHQDFPELH